MSGASVVLEISRSANNEVTVLATTTKSETSWWKKEVITLGDGAGDNDLTFYLTCDNGYGEIHSVVGDKCVGTVENATVWWNNFSDYYTIAANKTLTLNFKNYTRKNETWSNFVTVITNDYDRGVTGYAEQVVLRVDDYGWGTYYNHSNFSNNYSWSSFKNDMDGANVELKIRRLGTKVAVKATYTTTSGQKYYQQYVYTSPSDTDPMRVFLTVDNSHITNLTYSTTDTPVGSSEYIYSVKAKDNNNNELKTFATGSYWTGEDDVTVVYPYAIKPNEYWYTTSVATYATTINASNTTVNITYTKDESIVGFYEGETASGNQSSYSNGAYGTVAAQNKRDRGTDAGTLSPGVYKFVGRLVADDNSGRAITIREGTNDPMASLTGDNTTRTAEAEFTVYSTTEKLYINGANSGTEKTNLSTSFDYVLIKRTGNAKVSKTITSAGWATYCSPYPLDFSGTIENLTKAYLITGNTGATLNLTQITGTIPANKGILLEGEGAVAIPVVASSTTNVSTNKLVGVTSETLVADAVIYVLMNGANGVGFYETTNSFTVGANTAYLPANFAGARMAFFSFDETNAINDALKMKNDVSNDAPIYNINGQRVSKAEKGLYIINGKKIIKN